MASVREPRKASSSKRREAGKKPPKPRFLIVCEDSASSLVYFQQMQRSMEDELVIQLIPVHGGVPKNLIEKVEEKTQSDNQKLDCKDEDGKDCNLALDYDVVFAVFDMDVYAKSRNTANGSKITEYNNVAQKAKRLDSDKRPCRLIRSWPSFEYWVLLHIELYTTPVICQGQTTSGHVMTDLVEKAFERKYGVKYEKSEYFAKSLYQKLKGDQKFALENSKQRYQQALQSINQVSSLNISREQCEDMNPFTEMHLLINSIFKGKCIEPWGIPQKVKAQKSNYFFNQSYWMFSDFKTAPFTLEYLSKYIQAQYT